MLNGMDLYTAVNKIQLWDFDLSRNKRGVVFSPVHRYSHNAMNLNHVGLQQQSQQQCSQPNRQFHPSNAKKDRTKAKIEMKEKKTV